MSLNYVYTNKILYLFRYWGSIKQLFEESILLLKLIFRNTDLINLGEISATKDGKPSEKEEGRRRKHAFSVSCGSSPRLDLLRILFL